MDNKLLDCQVNNICEAYGCFKKATTKINVRAGQLGTIPLDLCIECVEKFSLDTPENNLKQSEEDKGRMR